jgi:hypothetical protein
MRRDGGAVSCLVLVDLEGIAAEQDAPPRVVQHRLPLVMPADMVQHEAGCQLQRLVIGPGNAEGLGQPQVLLLDRQDLRPEHVLQLPQRAVAMDVRGGEEADAAQPLDLGEHLVGVEGRRLEGDVALRVQQQPARAVQPERRRDGEGDHVPLQPPPVAAQHRPHLLDAEEAPAILWQVVARVGADRAVGRRGEVALPVAAIGAGIGFQRHGALPAAA